MPAQKRSYDTPPTPPPLPDEKNDDSLQGNQNHDEEAYDSDGTCIHRGALYIIICRFVCLHFICICKQFSAVTRVSLSIS